MANQKWRRIVVEDKLYRWIYGAEGVHIVRLDERGKGVQTHVMPHPKMDHDYEVWDPEAGPLGGLVPRKEASWGFCDQEFPVMVTPSDVAGFIRGSILGLRPLAPKVLHVPRYLTPEKRHESLGIERLKPPFADDAQGGYAVWLHREFYDDDRGDTYTRRDLIALRFDAKSAKKQVADLEQSFAGLRETMAKYPNWEADSERKELVERHLNKMVIHRSMSEAREQRRTRERVAKMMESRWDSFHFTSEVW